jgi:hypothetical protein
VYLRTEKPITDYKEISDEVIAECCQLTKANSIEGCKRALVGMNFTWATNLLKRADMQTGAVSYHDSKKVVKLNCEKNKDIIRQVMKTKSEAFPDFEKDYREYMKEVEREKNSKILEGKKAAAEEEKSAKDSIKAK